MSRSFGEWAPYVPVAARRRKAEREMEKLRKKGAVLSPVKIEGRQIARTFWGKAWCDNLESYRDYENRLPRGRTYVRNGSVVDLQIAPREVTAIVSGSKIYKVKVSIGNHFRSHDLYQLIFDRTVRLGWCGITGRGRGCSLPGSPAYRGAER